MAAIISTRKAGETRPFLFCGFSLNRRGNCTVWIVNLLVAIGANQTAFLCFLKDSCPFPV